MENLIFCAVNLLDFDDYDDGGDYDDDDRGIAQQHKQGRPSRIFSEFIKTKSQKIWDQRVDPFQNGSQFKLLRVNLTLPGSNRVKSL